MTKPNLLIVGAGGVGAVAAHKAAQFHEDFGRILFASRSLAKPEAIAADAQRRWAQPGEAPRIEPRQLDARDLAASIALLRETETDILLNLATPYCNTTLLDACLATGTHYLDTAVAEDEHVENMPAPWYARVEWPRKPKFAAENLSAILGIGFDPGVVNVMCAYAGKHLFDRIDSIDIIDVNGGDHGKYFATNFDPDTNLREIKEDVIFWEDGAFRTIPHHSKSQEVTLPQVGTHKVYSMGHDELHSLPRRFPEAKRIEFWMGFGDRYLEVFEVLNRLGLTSSIPVEVEGVKLAPIKMVKAVLPDPATLAAGYSGKVCIGCDLRGTKDGTEKRVFIYSNCDHRACYEEVGSQAISYTTGVPAMTAAILLARGLWQPGTLVNVEELDPDPFLDLMPKLGIDWAQQDLPLDGSWPFDDV
ncbi:MAG TPA: saccharopine dehydrogenase family protein [Kiloniellaceae bacterium]|nr:saccharopine dehydrogenase family protein [Kiloniellaceae bacterium]